MQLTEEWAIFPAGHFLHDIEPFSSEIIPSSQLLHWIPSFVYYPSGQYKHFVLAERFSEIDPAGHKLHLS